MYSGKDIPLCALFWCVSGDAAMDPLPRPPEQQKPEEECKGGVVQ